MTHLNQLFVLLFFIIYGTGFAQFSPDNLITNSPGLVRDMQIVDVNADGLKDIVFADSDRNRIFWFENLGANAFSEEQILHYASEPLQFEMFDADGDLDLDIMIRGGTNSGATLFVENTGSGFVDAAVVSNNLAGFSHMDQFDLENDGDIDILVSSKFSFNIEVLRNDGSNSFTVISVDDNLDNPDDAQVADINGDGLDDIVAIGNTGVTERAYWYENLGNGTFSGRITIGSYGNTISYVDCGDIDMDGDIDVVFRRNTQRIVCYLNEGGDDPSFTFQEIIADNELGDVRGTVVHDFDNDGAPDILVVDNDSPSREIFLYQNLGGLNFSDRIVVSSSIPSTSAVWFGLMASDLNNDGDSDIFYNSGAVGGGTIRWYENFLYSPYRAIGTFFFDENQNGMLDTLEAGFPYVEMYAGSSSAYSNQEGEYFIALTEGDYTLRPENLQGWQLTNNPDSINISLSAENPVANDANFGFYPDTLIHRISASLGSGQAVCDLDATLWGNYQNTGTLVNSGILTIQLDEAMTYQSAIPTPDSVSGSLVYFSFDALGPFHADLVRVDVLMPDFNFIDDTLISIFTATVLDEMGDIVEEHTDSLHQILLCAYDPNNKTVWPIGEDEAHHYVDDGELLEYRINFQNTGNFPATLVQLEDTLDTNLDLSSFRLLNYSHDVNVHIREDRLLVFRFEDINLPDSTSNEPESHGFVSFEIRAFDGLDPGTRITNTAYIYFDSNPAVITNQTFNTIRCYTAPMPDLTLSGITLNAGIEMNPDLTFEWYLADELVSSGDDNTFIPIVSGSYSVVVIDGNDCSNRSEAVQVVITDIGELDLSAFSIIPNPNNGEFRLNFGSHENLVRIEVLDIHGRVLSSHPATNQSYTSISIKLSAGIYFVRVSDEDGSATKRFVIQ